MRGEEGRGNEFMSYLGEKKKRFMYMRNGEEEEGWRGGRI